MLINVHLLFGMVDKVVVVVVVVVDVDLVVVSFAVIFLVLAISVVRVDVDIAGRVAIAVTGLGVTKEYGRTLIGGNRYRPNGLAVSFICTNLTQTNL